MLFYRAFFLPPNFCDAQRCSVALRVVFSGAQSCPVVLRDWPVVFRGVPRCSVVFRGVSRCSVVFRGVK
eukprot:4889644-Lingulodinium_polyedra.AAC.1